MKLHPLITMFYLQLNQTSSTNHSQSTSVATTTASQPSRNSSSLYQPPQSTTSTTGTSHTQHQPVEFNHAISYVNKIKVGRGEGREGGREEGGSLLERCPHFRGWYVQASMELGPEDVSLLEGCPFQFRTGSSTILTSTRRSWRYYTLTRRSSES